MFMLKREPDMMIAMAEGTLITTWENRSEILEIMRKAVHVSQEMQHLWTCSGCSNRLTQEHTDELVGLLDQMGDLGVKLSSLR
jgi:hypothetical protein